MSMRNHLKATNYWWAMATSASNVQRFFLQVSFSSFQIKLGFKTFFNLQWVCLVTTIASTSKGTWPTLASLVCTRTKCKLRTFPKMFIWKCSGASRVRKHFMTATPSSRILVWSTTWSTKCSRRKDYLEFHSIRSNPYLCNWFLSIDPRRHW